MNTVTRLSNLIKSNIRCLLVGPPGIGKTAQIILAANLAGYKVEVLRLSLAERPDVGGIYVPDLAAGVTRALPLALMHRLKSTSEKTLLFLDDIGQAPIDVQASAMLLFDEGQLPSNVLIWGATNRPGDKAGVTAIATPLLTRFHVAFAIATPDGGSAAPTGATLLGSWKETVEGWCDWATGEDFPVEIIAWHRSTTGRTLYGFKIQNDPSLRYPDFRSWATVARLWEAGLRDLDTVSAAIGRAAAAEFIAFASLADQLPTPQQVFLDPHSAPVPTEPAAQYLISGMLARALEPKFAASFITYIDRLPRAVGAFAAIDGYKRVGAKLAGVKEWQVWWVKNQALWSNG